MPSLSFVQKTFDCGVGNIFKGVVTAAQLLPSRCV